MLGVTLSRCVCVRRAAYTLATARRISLGGEGNVLYPVLSSSLSRHQQNIVQDKSKYI